MFSLMEAKVAAMNDQEKLCCLIFDEMVISSGCQYDVRSDSLVGHVTLPDQDDAGEATHVLVAMVCGLSTRYKQIVAYFFTGNSTPPKDLGLKILDILRETHKIGLKVISMTSDMGPSNQALNK